MVYNEIKRSIANLLQDVLRITIPDDKIQYRNWNLLEKANIRIYFQWDYNKDDSLGFDRYTNFSISEYNVGNATHLIFVINNVSHFYCIPINIVKSYCSYNNITDNDGNFDWYFKIDIYPDGTPILGLPGNVQLNIAEYKSFNTFK